MSTSKRKQSVNKPLPASLTAPPTGLTSRLCVCHVVWRVKSECWDLKNMHWNLENMHLFYYIGLHSISPHLNT